MPSIKTDGIQDVLSMLKRLGTPKEIEAVQKQAVYAGMAVVRDEMVNQINSLPVQNGYLKSKKLPRNVITDREKEQLLSHMGIAKMDNQGGTVSTSISFDGYTDIKTAAYPNGLPAVLVARSINSGSSVRKKVPFARRAAAAAKSRAVAAAEEAAREALQKIREG